MFATDVYIYLANYSFVPSIYQSIYNLSLFLYLLIYQPIYLSTDLSVYRSIDLSNDSTYLSIYLSSHSAVFSLSKGRQARCQRLGMYLRIYIFVVWLFLYLLGGGWDGGGGASVQSLHVEYEERRIKDGISFIFSPLYE